MNTSLLQILHDNWPEIAAGRVVGISGEPLTSTERIAIRKQNVNVATTMSDGTVYLSPGGGVTASGHCFFDIRDCARIFADLDNWQKVVEDNEANFRAALKMLSSEELSIKMMFERDECWLYEPSKHARLSLTLQQ